MLDFLEKNIFTGYFEAKGIWCVHQSLQKLAREVYWSCYHPCEESSIHELALGQLMEILGVDFQPKKVIADWLRDKTYVNRDINYVFRI